MIKYLKMGTTAKVVTTLIIALVGSLVVGIVGSEFGQGQYLVAGLVVIILFFTWSRPRKE